VEILFGSVSLDRIVYAEHGYETAIVRSATFDNPRKPFGAILGEVTVDRGGFAVRTTDQEVVGVIDPDLRIDGLDDVCDNSRNVVAIPISRGNYAIMSDNRPVGTINGFFPANDFGVPSR
jgi:hypothetical protein